MANKSRLVGVNRVRRTLRRIPEDARSGIRSALAAGADLMLNTAQSLVPVDSGLLRSQLRVQISRDGLGARIGLIGKRANRKAYYGRFIEDGTVKKPARPFLAPAFELHKGEVIEAVSKAMADTLEKASRGD